MCANKYHEKGREIGLMADPMAEHLPKNADNIDRLNNMFLGFGGPWAPTDPYHTIGGLVGLENGLVVFKYLSTGATFFGV